MTCNTAESEEILDGVCDVAPVVCTATRTLLYRLQTSTHTYTVFLKARLQRHNSTQLEVELSCVG